MLLFKRIFFQLTLLLLSINLNGQEKADYTKLDENGLNMFHKAILARDYPSFSYLVQQGIDLNIKTTDGRNPVQLALYAKFHSEDKEEKSDPHLRRTDYATLGTVESAIEYGNPRLAGQIIKNGVPFNPEGEVEKRIIKKSIDAMNVGPAVLELASGKRFTDAMTKGWHQRALYETMLRLVYDNNEMRQYALVYLRNHIDEINADDPSISYKLPDNSSATLRLLDPFIYYGDLKTAIKIVKRGVPLKTTNPMYKGKSPLNILYRNNDHDDPDFQEIFQLLLNKGTSFYAGHEGRKPIHEAAIQSDLKGILKIIEKDNCQWCADDEGNLWLHYYMRSVPDDGVQLGQQIDQLVELSATKETLYNFEGISPFFLLEDARQFQHLLKYPEILNGKTVNGRTLFQYKIDWLKEKGVGVEETAENYSFIPNQYYIRAKEKWNQILAMINWIGDNTNY